MHNKFVFCEFYCLFLLAFVLMCLEHKKIPLCLTVAMLKIG